jgi:CubicO group peptidase (beta-lactamase class C family)
MKRLVPFLAFLYYTSVSAQLNIDSVIQAQMTQKRIAAVSALIVKNGEPVWFKAYGKANVAQDINATSNMSFMLASISKTITATALMQVWENGSFELDDNINDYLAFDVVNPNFSSNAITFRHLLTHTSGISDDWNTLGSLYVYGDSPIPLADFCQGYLEQGGPYYNAASNFTNNAPGTFYEYSNVGATLCGYLVESITGIDFNQYCKDSIFEPLCMDNTSWFISELNVSNVVLPHYYENGQYYSEDHYGFPDYPDGQLRTNATSLGRFLNMYMNYGVYNGTRILDSATVATILTEQVPTLEDGQGLMWYSGTQSGKTWWGHNGGDLGVTTDMRFFPADSIGIVLLTNGDQANYVPMLNQIVNFAQSLPNINNTYPCGDLLDAEEYVYVPNALLNAYPNPANGFVTLETDKSFNNNVIDIYDMTGKKVKQLTKIVGSKVQVGIAELPAGIYSVHWNNSYVRFIKE